jgi:hypothetical protein
MTATAGDSLSCSPESTTALINNWSKITEYFYLSNIVLEIILKNRPLLRSFLTTITDDNEQANAQVSFIRLFILCEKLEELFKELNPLWRDIN